MPRMHKPFDVTPKSLAEAFPGHWFQLLGWPGNVVDVIDADVATVSGAADKVFRMRGAQPWLAMFEFLSSYKDFIPERLHWHSTLISHRHQMLVRRVVILLRQEADGPVFTGQYEEAFPDEAPQLIFRYRVLRLWEIPADRLAASGVGLALFAPLGKLEPNRLTEVVRKVRQRVDREQPQDAPDLAAAMYILMGLRYDSAIIQTIRNEVSEMEESITYQEIIKKGEAKSESKWRLEEAREFLVLMGSNRFGPPNAAALRRIRAIDDRARLHRLGLHINTVSSWKDLLAVK